MNSILFGYDENLNKNKRDCTHHECPYTYCQHHRYWNGIEQEKLSFSQMNNISIKDDEVDMCMSHMDI